MGNQQRPSGAAPASPPVGSKDFYEKTNPYWLQQAASNKRQGSRLKRQAASSKRREGGPASNKRQA